MDDSSSVFLIVLLGDPIRFEDTERSKGGSSDPDGVLSVDSGANSDIGSARS